ncbi:polysaccharide deacetylase family protein [Marinimicrobium sp. ARAG 43.8]|uniref:polysaccharide deacetylase family protein n=1 Tax=Marinimicrobium sp. ARAG 43.8 TaxID=3418719 RepID=UPI003CED3230
MRALVSIHDVMPHTLGQVTALLALMSPPVRARVVLLVVPGRDWTPMGIAQLACWEAEGLELAGHGWSHQSGPIRGLYHQLHSWCLSRQAAEHLSQSRESLRALLAKNHRWFSQNGLSAPSLYVPPAWALGRLTAADLRESPFDYIETTSGYRHLSSGKRCAVPLVGYEADNAWRAAGLSLWNRFNRAVASATGRPVRLALHPDDAELRLADELRLTLESLEASVDYRTLFSASDFTAP